jgi:hypothetical protein
MLGGRDVQNLVFLNRTKCPDFPTGGYGSLSKILGRSQNGADLILIRAAIELTSLGNWLRWA